jgi:PleD family two-component response regulator
MLAFPKLFQLDQISEWRSARKNSRDLLAPHLMSQHELTLEEAQELATACDHLTILPTHRLASERLQKLINQTVFQDQHVHAANSTLAGIK